MKEETARAFEAGETAVRRDVNRGGQVSSALALRVMADTAEALVTACAGQRRSHL